MKFTHIFLLILFFNNCSQKTKNLQVETDLNGTMYDLGKVLQTDTLRTTFYYKNEMNENLKFETPTSSGVIATLDKEYLKPNEIASINVVFPTNNLKGSQKRQISIKTDNKKEPYINYYIKAYVQNLTTYKRNKLFDLIINKKETYKDLPNKIDILRKYSKSEIRELNIDAAKQREEISYELIDKKFLKSGLENFKFTTYYISRYMSGVSKILRIEKNGSIHEIELASLDGDGLDWKSSSTEFINDSIFVETKVNNRTKKDDQYQMVYNIDSIISRYKYNQNLELKLMNKYSFSILKEINIDKATGKKSTRTEYFNSLGKIGNTEIVYSISYFSLASNLPEYLTFYVKDSTKELFKMEFGGTSIGEIEIFNVNGHNFIYIRMDETSGVMYGIFYSIDVVSEKANRVVEDYGNYKIPDSLENYSGFGILKNSENQFFSGIGLRSKKNGNQYMLNRIHKLVKNDNNEFVLKVVYNEITGGQY